MSEHTSDPDWQAHQRALSAYSVSQLPGYDTSDRYCALITGYELMTDLLQRNATVSRLLTAIRMAIDLGYRADALRMLNHLYNIFDSEQAVSVDEPFLSASARMAMIDPRSDIGQWLVYSILETREICKERSSHSDKSDLTDLELMRTSTFYSDKMERRRQLIQTRVGIDDR
jgi:hypothetical protein